jgi:DNA-binding CsgD family transcriptional regulator
MAVQRHMEVDTNTATALLSALRLSQEHGGATAALRVGGVDLAATERAGELSGAFQNVLGSFTGDDASVREALALGFLAGRVAQRPATRTRRSLLDPTSFVMDRELVVQAAEGESILRLPWFEDDLFVGRQLPDINEMPAPVLRLCVEHYSAAMHGERSRFTFTSYGHSYAVAAVPVYGDNGGVEAVLGIATPARSFAAGAMAYERTAERLDSSAGLAEERAERFGLAGRGEAEAAERQRAAKARRGAERARANAQRLRFRDSAAAPAAPPSVTPREAEVLSLASHGLTYAEIGEQLVVSTATVRTHLENIYPKLGVSDKAAAVAAALRHGLIE